MRNYNLTLKLAFILAGTKKDFFLFNYENGKIINYKVTNSLQDYYNKNFANFRLTDIIKQQIDTNLIFE